MTESASKFQQQVQFLAAADDPRDDIEPIAPPAIKSRRGRGARHRSTRKSAPGSDFDIRIPALVCRDPRLSAATKIIYGQIAQYAAKSGRCWALNGTLAKDCGVHPDTVSGAISTLVGYGLLSTDDDDSGRRHLSPTSGGSPPRPRTAEIAEAPAENIGGLRKTAEPCAENGRGHLNQNVIKKEDEDKKTSSSSSVVINRRPEDIPVDHQAGMAMVLQWARQIAGLIGKRLWAKRQPSGSDKVIPLGIPAPGKPSAREIEQLAAVAQEFWPGCDVLQGIRQLLRAASLTSDKRDRLQQYAYLASGGSLSVRALLHLGGREDPQAFLRESVGAVQEPLPAAPPGSSEDAALMIRLSYDMGQAWDDDAWLTCWAEAAGRCRDLGVEPQVFMAAVFHLYEQQGRIGVVPWIADSLTKAQLQEFLPRYKEDRKRAWAGRMGRRDPNDPRLCTSEYEFCMGLLVTQQAARGCTEFLSQACLLCAAAELRLIPELIQDVAWNQGADRLADLMESLAAQAQGDDPPMRGSACGQARGAPASYVRCFYGNARQSYFPAYDEPQSDREGLTLPVEATTKPPREAAPSPVAKPEPLQSGPAAPGFNEAAFLAKIRQAR